MLVACGMRATKFVARIPELMRHCLAALNGDVTDEKERAPNNRRTAGSLSLAPTSTWNSDSGQARSRFAGESAVSFLSRQVFVGWHARCLWGRLPCARWRPMDSPSNLPELTIASTLLLP